MATPIPQYVAESRTIDIYIGLSLPIPIIILSTSLRLWSELYLHHNRLKVDDVLIFIATVATIGFNATCLQAPRYGFGRHTQAMPEESLIPFGKVIFVAMEFYLVANACTKLSVLALYYRVFPSLAFRRITSATGVVTILWLIATDLTWTLQCLPVQKLWNKTLDGKCIARAALYYQTGSNVGLDVWIFTMPLPLIAKMRAISTRNKISLVVLFSVGLASCVLGAVRSAWANRMVSSDVTWDAVPFGIVSDWELVTTLLCANLPIIYKPIAAGLRRARALGLDSNEHAQAVYGLGHIPPHGRNPHTRSRSRSRVSRAPRAKHNMNMDVNLAYSIRLPPESELVSGSSGTQATTIDTVVSETSSSGKPAMELKDVGGLLVEKRVERSVTIADENAVDDS
ncbi:hypothetical protein BDW74DRAFT_183689 [Aspergillus multicolor]|uniref:uncharacterized protein n=1 Tax=Aspergillus multicolor TaxID=41759 RepID=UPI003CCCB035